MNLQTEKKSLWGGRQSQDQDEFFASFNASFPFDKRLIHVDLRGSIAYAKALAKAEVLTPNEAERITWGLQAIAEKAAQEPSFVEQGVKDNYEDVHAFVEAQLVNLIGPIAGKLHSGRSRNDQVATDLRMFARDAVDQVSLELSRLQSILIEHSQRYEGAYLPGYTHLQRAQPVLWPHYLLSFFTMFERDKERLRDSRRRINVMPLGSGALAGSNYSIDREELARDLGFSEISSNSMDATSDRDFIVEVLCGLSLVMTHLSRLAEDLIIYATQEFRFVKLSDKVSTGSSLMPQKKNPDALELIRGKTGRVYGHLTAMLTVLKGLPSCYNKDLQEDKEALFGGIDTVVSCLRVMGTVVSTMELDSARTASACDDGFLNATDLADFLVDKGMPFRDAHHLVGQIVNYCADKGICLNQLPLATYQGFSALFTDGLFSALKITATLDKKRSQGGTAPHRVREALAAAKDLIAGFLDR
jgi:argininosuccinate lyase